MVVVLRLCCGVKKRKGTVKLSGQLGGGKGDVQDMG